ncbi:MAG: PaaI family thioesterase [Spirochaetes bacterium]|nr:PaaI family thioesterase [Spirochaetota bacterium]
MEHKVTRKQQNGKMCMVCGTENVLGLNARFYETESNDLVAIFSPKDEHQSYPGRMHGGLITAILDETISRAVMINSATNVWGVTIEINVKFKKPAPLNEEIKVVGRIDKYSNRIFEGSAELILENGDVAAIAQGKYLRVPFERITDYKFNENEWRVLKDDKDPTHIDY